MAPASEYSRKPKKEKVMFCSQKLNLELKKKNSSLKAKKNVKKRVNLSIKANIIKEGSV